MLLAGVEDYSIDAVLIPVHDGDLVEEPMCTGDLGPITAARAARLSD
ncbi:hypothetical protein [Actinomycetospora sp. TBRC 11914]|nr:hypothetical protein [Actinomycetospora sp. TBRC 11914]NMO91543.1 hypothetical protein [Actinomycetospora sp. TBRC 11914]